MNMIGYIWVSDSKIDKAPNKMTIARQIKERITIRSTELNIELHRSLNNALITKSSMSKEILDILFLGDIKAIRSGGNLNPKKIAKRTKISHKKLLTKTGLNKGNVLRVIAGDDHVIHIEEEKSLPMRRSVNKQRGIMSAGRNQQQSPQRRSAQTRREGPVFRPYRERRRRQTMPPGTEYPEGGCMKTSSHNSSLRNVLTLS
jgi:hypothetical protein